jgi:hypothetical protein
VVPTGSPTTAPDPRSDLRSGIVRGGGLTLRPRQAAAAEAPPAKVPPSAEEVEMAAPPLVEAHAPASPPPFVEAQAPAPPEPSPPPPPEASLPPLPPPAPPAPAAAAGRATLASSEHPAVEPEPEPEPAGSTRALAGFLVFDDGSAVVLDDDYVLGREPEGDPTVAQGHAKALVVEDPSLMVSRVHARISVRDGEVVVVDANSANGTLVAGPDDEGWSPLEPETPLVIAPGTRILLGERSLVYERRPPSQSGAS